MRTVKKNVYYCDHCSKKGLSAHHLRHHESRCTANPKRWCGTCENTKTAEIVQGLIARFTLAENLLAPPYDVFEETNTDEKIVTWVGAPITMDEIRELTGDCPTCILAVLRQSGLNRHYFHLEPFDYKEELREWMKKNQQMYYHD